jgi:hypothetical protein
MMAEMGAQTTTIVNLTSEVDELKKSNKAAKEEMVRIDSVKADKSDVGPSFDMTSLDERLGKMDATISTKADLSDLTKLNKAHGDRLEKIETSDKAHLKRTAALEAELKVIAARLASAASAEDMKKFAGLAGRVDVLERDAVGLTGRVSKFQADFEKEMQDVRPLVDDTAELKRQMKAMLDSIQKVRNGLDGKASKSSLDAKMDQPQTEDLILKFLSENQEALRAAIALKADKRAVEDQLSVVSRFMKEITEQLKLDEATLNRIKGALPGKADKKTIGELMKMLGKGRDPSIAAGSKTRCLSCDQVTSNLPPGNGKSSHHFRSDIYGTDGAIYHGALPDAPPPSGVAGYTTVRSNRQEQSSAGWTRHRDGSTSWEPRPPTSRPQSARYF